MGKERSLNCNYTVEVLEKVIKLMVSLCEVPDKLTKSPLAMITHQSKRTGILGNYCQILLPICQKVKLTADQFQVRRGLLKNLSDASNEYTDLKPRDLCDVVHSVCNLQSVSDSSEQTKWLEKELRVLAKRAAFCLGDMNPGSREMVRDSFAMVDFYDAELV